MMHLFYRNYQPIRADKTGTFYCQLKSADGLQWTTDEQNETTLQTIGLNQ